MKGPLLPDSSNIRKVSDRVHAELERAAIDQMFRSCSFRTRPMAAISATFVTWCADLHTTSIV